MLNSKLTGDYVRKLKSGQLPQASLIRPSSSKDILQVEKAITNSMNRRLDVLPIHGKVRNNAVGAKEWKIAVDRVTNGEVCARNAFDIFGGSVGGWLIVVFVFVCVLMQRDIVDQNLGGDSWDVVEDGHIGRRLKRKPAAQGCCKVGKRKCSWVTRRCARSILRGTCVNLNHSAGSHERPEWQPSHVQDQSKSWL